MPNVKGSAVDARFRFVQTKFGNEGLERLLAALPVEDRDLYKATILPSSWYPFATFVRVTTTIDKTFGKGDLSLIPEIARWAADANLTTLYRFFYRIGSVAFVLGMAARLWRVHYDAGELQVQSGSGTATIRIEGWPEPHRAHCLSVSAWAGRSAELSGGIDVKLEELSCRASGGKTCEFRITWT